MNGFKKVSQASLFALLVIATLAIMAGSATATSASTAAQEKMFIAHVQFIAGTGGGNDTINLTVANMGPRAATIMGCAVRDENWNEIIFIEIKPPQPIIEKSSFDQISLTVKPEAIVDGKNYTLTVVTASGGSFVSSEFDPSSSTEYDPLKDEELQSRLQATPPPQAISTPFWSSSINFVFIGSSIAAVVSVMGAYKVSQYIVSSKDRKDRYVVFFLLSVIFVSIIITVVSSIWFSGSLSTM